jgi:outer membrane protein assembly factor BamB
MQMKWIRVFLGGVVVATAASGSAMELLVSNYFGNNISRFDMTSGAALGTMTGGGLSGTLGTRVGPDGLLYVCSETTNSLLRFNLTTHAFVDTFVAGNGLSNPTAITFDSSGNVLAANFVSSTVTKYSSSGAFLSTLVSSGSGGLNGPDIGTVIGPDGKLYVPSFNSNAVLRYDATTGAFLDTFVPAGGPGAMSQPRTILFRNNMVWITSDNGNKVLRYGLDGSFIDTFVASGAGGLNGATGMVFGDDGLLYISSWRNNKVLRYSASTGAFVDTFATTGLNGPVYLTAVPEPATFVGIGIGLAAVSLARRKRPTTQ